MPPAVTRRTTTMTTRVVTIWCSRCAIRVHHAPDTGGVTGVSGTRGKVVFARCYSEIVGYAGSRQLEPAQRFEVVSHAGGCIAGRLSAVRGETLRLGEVLLEQRLVRADLVVWIAHLSSRVVVVHVGEAKRRLDRTGAVVPQAGDGVEPVVGEEARAG